jgi:hypothetical protein
MRGNEMKKFTMISGVALLAVSLSGTAFAQGANPSAPQPNSTGTGVVQPGTTSTGTATDAKMKTGKARVRDVANPASARSVMPTDGGTGP